MSDPAKAAAAKAPEVKAKAAAKDLEAKAKSKADAKAKAKAEAQAKEWTVPGWEDELENAESKRTLGKLGVLLMGMNRYPYSKAAKKRLCKKLMDSLASLGISNLKDLENFNDKLMVSALGQAVDAKSIASLTRVAKFARINEAEHVLEYLGIEAEDVTAETIKWVTISWDRRNELPNDVELIKQIPTMNEQNAYSVLELFKQLAYDLGIGRLLETDAEGKPVCKLTLGEMIFENLYLLRGLNRKFRRTASAHIIGNEKFNGVKALQELTKAFMPVSYRIQLATALETQLNELKLLRLKDINAFFTVMEWYMKGLQELDPEKWTTKVCESKVKHLVTNSRGDINPKEQVLGNILSGFAQDGNKQDIKELKQVLYRDCSAIMLTKNRDDACSWFFPDYMNVARYKTLIDDIASGKEPPAIDTSKAARRKLNRFKGGPTSDQENDAEEESGGASGQAVGDAATSGGDKPGEKKKKRKRIKQKNGNKKAKSQG